MVNWMTNQSPSNFIVMKRETARSPIRNGQALTETTDSSPHSSKSDMNIFVNVRLRE